MNLQTAYNNVRYFLNYSNLTSGRQEILEPKNWNKKNFTIKRHEKYFGIFMKVTNQITFTNNFSSIFQNNSKEMIDAIYNKDGIEAVCAIERWDKIDEEWRQTELFLLDFSTIVIEQNFTRINIGSERDIETFLNKKNEKYELNIDTDVDNNTINPLVRSVINIPQGALFFKGLLRSIRRVNQDVEPLDLSGDEIYMAVKYQLAYKFNTLQFSTIYRQAIFPIALKVINTNNDRIVDVNARSNIEEYHDFTEIQENQQSIKIPFIVNRLGISEYLVSSTVINNVVGINPAWPDITDISVYDYVNDRSLNGSCIFYTEADVKTDITLKIKNGKDFKNRPGGLYIINYREFDKNIRFSRVQLKVFKVAPGVNATDGFVIKETKNVTGSVETRRLARGTETKLRIEGDGEITFTLERNERLAIGLYMDMLFRQVGPVPQSKNVQTECYLFGTLELSVISNLTTPDLLASAVRPTNLFDYLFNKISLRNKFKSDFFKTNNLCLTNGLYLRPVKLGNRNGRTANDVKDTKDLKDIETSLEEALDNYTKALGVTLGYYKGVFSIEKWDTFFKTQVGLKLNKHRITKQQIKPYNEYIYSEIKAGYKKDIQYNKNNVVENAETNDVKQIDAHDFNFEEQNLKASYTTNIKILEKTLDLEMSYRTDYTGIELQKTKIDNNTDTENDNDLFLIDAVFSTGDLKQLGLKTYQELTEDQKNQIRDHFITIANDFTNPGDFPKRLNFTIGNNYRYNLLLSPRSLVYINQHLVMRSKSYKNDFIRKTTDGYKEYVGVYGIENRNIPVINSNFDSLFKAEVIEFIYPITSDILDALMTPYKGTYMGYFLIEYINEYGQKEYGYLLELEEENNKWKLLRI